MLTRVVLLIVLSLVLVVVIIVVLGSLVLPPQDPSARAITDLRNCERRVGIPSPLDPTYQAVQQARYGAYVACMVGLGYTPQTLP